MKEISFHFHSNKILRTFSQKGGRKGAPKSPFSTASPRRQFSNCSSRVMWSQAVRRLQGAAWSWVLRRNQGSAFAAGASLKASALCSHWWPPRSSQFIALLKWITSTVYTLPPPFLQSPADWKCMGKMYFWWTRIDVCHHSLTPPPQYDIYGHRVYIVL